MNIERINHCIELMQGAMNLNMAHYQRHIDEDLEGSNSIEELHACGNSACFAGYLALSEEFLKAGGVRMVDGDPGWFVNEAHYRDFFQGVDAVAKFLELDNQVDDEIIEHIVFGTSEVMNQYVETDWIDWTPKHVIKILTDWRDRKPEFMELFNHV